MHVYSVKSNAARAAKAQTAKTGEAHQVETVEGGFAVISTAALQARLAAEEAAKRAAEEAATKPAAPDAAPRNGKARALIIAQTSRPEGATAAELYAATGWTKTSWNHQLNQAAKATGLRAEVRKAEGIARYFLVQA